MNIRAVEHTIESERLILMPFTAQSLALFNADVSAFEKLYGVKYCGEDLNGEYKSFLKKIEQNIAADPENYLFFTVFSIIVKETGKIVGSIDFKYAPKNSVTEVGYGLNPEYRGKGFMTEALSAFLNFGKKLGVKSVIAETLKDNVKSQNVLRRCGFKVLCEDKNILWEKKL